MKGGMRKRKKNTWAGWVNIYGVTKKQLNSAAILLPA